MKPIKQTYLFLSAQQYRMKDEDTGSINEGISLWYVPDDTLEPEQDDEREKRGELTRGKKVAKMAITLDKKDKLKAFPGLYEVTLEMVTVAQKQQVRARDLEFVSEVKLVAAEKPKG